MDQNKEDNDFPPRRWLPCVIVHSAYYPLLRFINENIYDPFPYQSLDFRLAGGFASAAMMFVGDKNKKLEFLAAMSPAIIGSLDEATNFMSQGTDVSDPKDVVAYFSGALLAYTAVKGIRRVVDHFRNRKSSEA